MEDQLLITKLKALKNISPRKEWVVLSKMQILDGSSASFMSMVPAMFGKVFQQKYAFTFAALAILMVGSVAVIQSPGNSGVSIASPAALVLANDSVQEFKMQSKELAGVSKIDKESFVAVEGRVKAAAMKLTETIQKDPGVAREVALEINNNKTYLDVQGSEDLKAISNKLYENIVKQMIKDLEKTSLTESQQKALEIAKDLYDKERYADALESILLLSMAIKNN